MRISMSTAAPESAPAASLGTVCIVSVIKVESLLVSGPLIGDSAGTLVFGHPVTPDPRPRCAPSCPVDPPTQPRYWARPIGFAFEPRSWDGEPVNTEPHKHSELVWAAPRIAGQSVTVRC